MEGLSLDPRMLYDQVRMTENGKRGPAPDGSGFDRLLKSGMEKERKEAELKKACSAFESMFVEQMLKAMRKNVQKGELLNGGFAEQVFEDMLYGEYAQKMAESGSLGVGRMLYDSLSRYI